VYKGTTFNASKNEVAQFISITIQKKNISTFSDYNGKFEIFLPSEFDIDSLIFSSIGFERRAIKIGDFKNDKNEIFYINESTTNLKEVPISSNCYEDRLFGITSNSKKLRFISHKQAGHEYCLLVNIKKSALIQKVFFNIAYCTYDSAVFRLNIYRQTPEDGFENILKKPIYAKVLKTQIDKQIVIDLTEEHIFVDDNFLIALENVNQLGKGELSFCAKMFKETLSRESNNSPFKTDPVGISLSVEAKVEK